MADVVSVKRLRPEARLPERATETAAGLDLFACLPDPGYITIGPDPRLVPTGIAIELPPGFEAQVRPRSGLYRGGVACSFGTIDSDYRGEVFVTLHTVGSCKMYRVRDGDRIAQLVVQRLPEVILQEADELTVTARGAGGHGSTGL